MTITMQEIGTISTTPRFEVRIHKEFAPGLKGLQGFSHVLILWHAHRAPAWDPAHLILKKPYRLAPENLGVFATRSSLRPNGLCVSVAAVHSLDLETGSVELFWTDAEEGTPVLDIKPYQWCSENVAGAAYPEWCRHWPTSYEASAAFDWDHEFLFPH